jgi:hypothetical protein
MAFEACKDNEPVSWPNVTPLLDVVTRRTAHLCPIEQLLLPFCGADAWQNGR